ncbi:MAG: FtsX-like permease family protein [Pseudomonadales bacterium]|nr:FtsX-like permease family protein [Pseudomonadales bacterium]
MLSQIKEITLLNLLNLPSRLGSSSVIIVGIAGVVAVLVGLLSMATGFTKALESAGKPDRAIIMRDGTTSEMNGSLTVDQRAIISAMEGVVVGSGELYVVVDLRKIGTDIDANVVVRGVEQDSFAVRPEIQIVAGRNFEPGRSEVVVGVQAVQQFSGLQIGDEVPVRDQTWLVVGHFDAGGSAYGSEIWADLAGVQAAFRRGGFATTMRVQMESVDAVTALDDRLQADPRFDLTARSEADHYAAQAEARATLINSFGQAVGVIMAIGAVFAALNTMYSAVSARTVEIATLRALGFGSAPVVFSVMIEAITLALLGGLLGGGLVWLAFDGYSASTLNNASFSQVAFDFAVTPDLLQMGVTWALVLGIVGGAFPAIRAARLPITTALRGE